MRDDERLVAVAKINPRCVRVVATSYPQQIGETEAKDVPRLGEILWLNFHHVVWMKMMADSIVSIRLAHDGHTVSFRVDDTDSPML